VRLPIVDGVVERRLLVNYRVDPEIAARLLPAPFRPQVVNGWAVAGICLIRLGELRPRGVPRRLGLRSENAAHRIAVHWDAPDGTLAAGVWIPRRHTGAAFNAVAGGRLFPGDHDSARFTAHESAERVRVAFDGAGAESVDVTVEVAGELGPSELFADAGEASRLFEAGSIGYSPNRRCADLDGLELRTDAWHVEPARVTALRSSFFEDERRFPPGAAQLDCALLMRDVPVTWHALAPLAARRRRLAWVA
jgi:hypothetical protein